MLILNVYDQNDNELSSQNFKTSYVDIKLNKQDLTTSCLFDFKTSYVDIKLS